MNICRPMILALGAPQPQLQGQSHTVRNLMIVVAVVFLVLVVLGAAFYLAIISTPPLPVKGVGGFAVSGSRAKGWTASFLLINSNDKVEASDGNVTFLMMDGRLNVLYRSTFHVTSSEFNVMNHSLGFFGNPSYGPGYQWRIPASQVATTAVPSTYEAQARLDFAPPTGGNFSIMLSGGFTV